MGQHFKCLMVIWSDVLATFIKLKEHVVLLGEIMSEYHGLYENITVFCGRPVNNGAFWAISLFKKLLPSSPFVVSSIR